MKREGEQKKEGREEILKAMIVREWRIGKEMRREENGRKEERRDEKGRDEKRKKKWKKILKTKKR